LIFLDVDRAKIQFSDAEQRLMRDPGVILTKNKVIAGIVQLFAGLQHSLEKQAKECDILRSYLPDNAKISKGENYQGLPYVILDYPRSFEGKNIFAIRTMFWWGHFFSMTLHLAGDEKNKFQEKIENARERLARMNAFISAGADPWQHHFEPDNYIPVASLSTQNFLAHCWQHEHLKIAVKWPLEEIAGIENELEKCWLSLVGIIE
jgi:hypothetical protein